MNAGADVMVKNVRQVRTTIDANDPMGGQPAEVLFAHTSGTSAAYSDSLVAAVTGKKIRVLSVLFTGDASNKMALQSGTHVSFTALTPAIPCTLAVQQIADPDFGICQTAVSAALSVSWNAGSGSSAFDITVAYCLVV
jgi:hypothetical protein